MAQILPPLESWRPIDAWLATHAADRGYDHDTYRRLLWQRGIRPAIAERGRPHGTGLGISRRVVERTISRLHDFRRPRIHCGRRDHIHDAFLGPATCLITHRHLQRLRRDISGK
ncbi:hypothetical protein ACWDY4_24010 [Streptomyces olivaceoviridis]